MRCHVVPSSLLVLLLESTNLLLLGLEVGLQPVILALKLINLMFEISKLCVPGSLLSLMAEHELSLLGFSPGSSLFDFSLARVKVLSFLIQLILEVKHLALFLLLEKFELFLDTLVKLTLLLVPLVQVAGLAHLVARLELKTLVHVGLVSFKSLKFLVKLIAIVVEAILLLLHTHGKLAFKLLDHL